MFQDIHIQSAEQHTKKQTETQARVESREGEQINFVKINVVKIQLSKKKFF